MSSKKISLTSQDAALTQKFSRVILVAMENCDYTDVIGSKYMPFVNKLASSYGLATNFFANTHPSIGNYFMLTTGKVITNNSYFTGVVSDNNLVRQLNAAHKTWGVFAESLPTAGYIGFNSGKYVKRHNPFAYFSDVRDNPTQASQIIPYLKTDFETHLNSNSLPDFAYILPNQQSNMHDCPPKNRHCTLEDKLAYGDKWLQDNLTPILNDSEFMKSGLLILTFDEASERDRTHGGGRIAFILVSGRGKLGYKSNHFYQHENALRLICDTFGLSDCPGAASNASGMSEFFQSW
jgi:acid phosphatase